MFTIIFKRTDGETYKINSKRPKSAIKKEFKSSVVRHATVVRDGQVCGEVAKTFGREDYNWAGLYY